MVIQNGSRKHPIDVILIATYQIENTKSGANGHRLSLVYMIVELDYRALRRVAVALRYHGQQA